MTNNSTFLNLLKTIGPGLLFAGAAIGGSHLIQSTRAGANYGFQLVWLVIIANFLKFPFFEYGKRYLAATGENLISGYAKIGKWAVAMFFVLSVITGIANVAGVTIVTSGLLEYIFENLIGYQVNGNLLSVIIIVLSLLILLIGKYSFLDKIIKIMIILLSISTVFALIFALSEGQLANPNFIPPEILNKVGIGFLISLLGWMPAPIEASVWTSVWGEDRTKQTGYKPNLNEHKIDFYIGYIGTGILALIFIGLGAYVMYGTGEKFASSGVAFSAQLVELYSQTIGKWSVSIIATIAFVTMTSTVLTVIDAYPKSLSISQSILFNSSKNLNRNTLIWSLILSVIALLIIFRFTNQMKNLIDLATIISFIASSFFSILNFMTVTNKDFPDEFKPKLFMRIISVLGIIFFVSFSIVYLLTRMGIIFN